MKPSLLNVLTVDRQPSVFREVLQDLCSWRVALAFAAGIVATVSAVATVVLTVRSHP